MATVLGQAIYNNENLKLYNLSFLSDEKHNPYHISSESGLIDISNVTFELLRQNKNIQMGPMSNAILLMSGGITIQQGLSLVCPIGFNSVKRTSTLTRVYD